MANRPASFFTQAKALFLKNLTLQKRDMRTNLGLVSFPVLLLLLLLTIQQVINHVGHKLDGVESQICSSRNASDTERRAANCPGVKPLEKPALLQVPPPGHRAVRTDSTVTYQDLPDSSCRRNGSCPVTLLLTGTNRTLGESLGRNLFSTSFPTNSSSDNHLYILANLPLGEEAFSSSESDDTDSLQTVQHGVEDEEPSVSYFLLQPQCTENSRLPVPLKNVHIQCLQSLPLWRNSSSAMNDELFKGFVKGNSKKEGNEYMAAFDFLNTSEKNFNVSISYNGTLDLLGGAPRLMNLASNAFLQLLRGAGVKLLLDYVEDMPQPAVPMLRIDVSSSISGIFYAWVILFLFPVILTTLVYEKQQNQNIRIMMKMHGLGDGPYWMITYAYFLIISLIYVLLFVVFGSLIGLKFFTLNDYGIQFVFYFICINLQIALAFLVATFFSNVKTATVTAYLYAFASGLLGENLFRPFMEDLSFPRRWVIVMELIPGFSLYRGIYEFIQCSDLGTQMGIRGMRWKDLNDYTNGLKEVYIIMLMEWLIVLFVAYYMDQVMLSGSGVRKHPLFFFKKFCKKASPSLRRSSLPKEGSHIDEMEKPDVSQETQKVQELLLGGSTSHVLISDNIGKVYPGKDGNQEKTAVKGLSLAVRRGECFGLLGPNGAGKTSWFSMMTGLTAPTSGTAFVQGFDIRTDMDKVYTSMGVCPQHDLLWETLTGREHLLFYGRLRNLKGEALTQAVEDSLKSVNLEAFGDKQSSQYSGGMKRRLSVAISLIGDPQVVYMDEPSTGLDPASRNLLWKAVTRAKRDRAIVLTTHSMEEAEALCDRLGIFVDGSLQCIGNSKELKGRYGGSYVFTMTTSSNAEELVEAMVHRLSPSAKKIYQLSGTQKFEMPKEEVRIADVFLAVERAKSRCTIQAWGLVDTTLEDVFIKVARGAQAFKVSTSSS